MKTYQGLILAAFLFAALLLAGCESNQSGPPPNDTSQKIMSGNNPNEQPLTQGRPGGGTTANAPGGGTTANAPGGGATPNAPGK